MLKFCDETFVIPILKLEIHKNIVAYHRLPNIFSQHFYGRTALIALLVKYYIINICDMMRNNFILSALICASLICTSGCAPLFVGGLANVGVASTEERSLGENIDDSAISAEIQQFFIGSKVKHVFGDVIVRVHEGRVLLIGRTDNQQVKDEATRLAWEAHGVREVMNEIKVGGVSEGLLDSANNNLIETQIEARLLADKNIKSANYVVEVVDGTAYLLGIAQNEKERNIAAYIASISKGVREVVSFVRLKDDPMRLQVIGKPREVGVNRPRGIFE
jgi:osmotically-inducible protein OsmY